MASRDLPIGVFGAPKRMRGEMGVSDSSSGSCSFLQWTFLALFVHFCDMGSASGSRQKYCDTVAPWLTNGSKSICFYHCAPKGHNYLQIGGDFLLNGMSGLAGIFVRRD